MSAFAMGATHGTHQIAIRDNAIAKLNKLFSLGLQFLDITVVRGVNILYLIKGWYYIPTLPCESVPTSLLYRLVLGAYKVMPTNASCTSMPLVAMICRTLFRIRLGHLIEGTCSRNSLTRLRSCSSPRSPVKQTSAHLVARSVVVTTCGGVGTIALWRS